MAQSPSYMGKYVHLTQRDPDSLLYPIFRLVRHLLHLDTEFADTDQSRLVPDPLLHLDMGQRDLQIFLQWSRNRRYRTPGAGSTSGSESSVIPSGCKCHLFSGATLPRL